MTRTARALLAVGALSFAGCTALDERFCASFEKGELARCTDSCTAELVTSESRARCTKDCQGSLGVQAEYATRCAKPPTTAGDRAYCDTFASTFKEQCQRGCETAPKSELQLTCARECVKRVPGGDRYSTRCPRGRALMTDAAQ